MKKRMIIMIVFLLVVFGGIFGWDAVRAYFMAQFFAHFQPPPASISTVLTKKENLESSLSSVGTLVAVNGVTISPEVSGIISSIDFTSGQIVQKGQLIIQINDSVEKADLENGRAALELAKLEFKRTSDLLKKKVTSQSDFDSARATLQQAQAVVDKTQALIAQKNIIAPFTGKIGIREINLGQYVSAGTAMVSLQALSPIYVNFYLPEQDLPKVFVDQTVHIRTDTYPDQVFSGKVSAINSLVDVSTHNFLVQATLPNKDEKLYPGLFATINVIEPHKQAVIVVPSTAVTYSLFGNTVYVLEKPKKPEKSKDGKPIYIAKQRYVKTGKQTGDKVVILEGLEPNQQVVSSGQLKLSNDARVVINNSVKLDQKQNEIY